jgi:hypothetical protein
MIMDLIDATPAASTVECLPSELLSAICDLLPNSDIKNLGLAGPLLGRKCQLQISRVFISPNPRNLDVVRSIASHENYHLGIEEVIWDDATLMPFGHDEVLFDEYSDESEEEDSAEKDAEVRECFSWYTRGCKRNIKAVKDRMADQVSRPDAVSRQHQLDNAMSYRDSFEYYKVLESQQ